MDTEKCAKMEVEHDSINEKIERIMENHLPHLAEDISHLKVKVATIEGKLAIILGVIVTSLVGIFVNIYLSLK